MATVTVFSTLGMGLIALAFSLVVWAVGFAQPSTRYGFFICGIVAFALGFVALGWAARKAIREDRKANKDRERLDQTLSHLSNIMEEVKKDRNAVTFLTNEIRQDRNERQHGHR